MIENTTLKIFLTSGVTLTVSNREKIIIDKISATLDDLYDYIDTRLQEKHAPIEFQVEIDHTYMSEEKTPKKLHQEVKHYYNIPYDKVSWFLIEEV